MTQLMIEYAQYVGDDIIEKGSSKETPKQFIISIVYQSMGRDINYGDAKAFLSRFYSNREVDNILDEAFGGVEN